MVSVVSITFVTACRYPTDLRRYRKMSKKHAPNQSPGSPTEESRFYAVIERIGNKFPAPFLLFIILSVLLLLVAELMAGTSFLIPGTENTMEVRSLLNREGFVYIISHLTSNFISFPLIPLIVLFALAIGVGEYAGLYNVLILKFFRNIPDSLLYFTFMFVAVNGNIISDATLILLPVIGAELFISKGKNPVLAVIISFAGYLAGLSANVIIVGTDVLCAGITESALPLLPITAGINIHPASNWFFMFVSAVLIALVGTYTTVRFVEPRMMCDTTITWDKVDPEKVSATYLVTPEQQRGLRMAGITSIIYFALVGIMLLPGGWLRDIATDTLLPESPFVNNVTVVLALYFFLIGIAYGFGAGTLKHSGDVSEAMGSGLQTIISLLVVFFFAAQFCDYFNQTNLATYIAVAGADFLKKMDFTGLPLLLLLVLFTAIINFFIGTVGSKWSVMAPIMVPMLALLGYHPAFAQCVYRIGDSITNTINPISVYIPIVLTYVKKYRPDSGIGTIVSYQIPYFVAFTLIWVLQLAVWYFLKLPVGPLAPMFI